MTKPYQDKDKMLKELNEAVACAENIATEEWMFAYINDIESQCLQIINDERITKYPTALSDINVVLMLVQITEITKFRTYVLNLFALSKHYLKAGEPDER